MRWKPEDLSAERRLGRIACEASERFPDIELQQDVEWLDKVARHRGIKPFVLCARDDGRLVGFAPFEVQASTLKLALGDIVLWSERVSRFAMESGPLVDCEPAEPAIEACFAALAERMPDEAVVFLRGVPTQSPLHRVLRGRRNALRSKFNVVPHGPTYMRCRIRWDGSVARYLETLGKVSRKDLRRTLRKAPDVLGADPRLVAFASPSDVPRFISDAASVSKKTYQAKEGIGMVDSEANRAALTTAAEGGHLLGHVLYRENEPIAYHLGFIHGQRFYMIDGGYDPAWAKAQVGIFTFLKVLQDIEARRLPIKVMDYLYGDGRYKLRTSNEQTPERHYYLTKRRLRGTLLATGLKATDAISRSVGALLEKFALKDRVKELMGRRNGKRHNAIPLAVTAAVADFESAGLLPILCLA